MERRNIRSSEGGETAGCGFNSVDLSLCDNGTGGGLGVSSQTQSGKMLQVGSSSSIDAHGDFSNSKSKLHLCKVKQLQRRIQILEEGTEAMKKELFACVEECNQLLNEVTQKLYTVHQNLRSRMIGEECVKGTLILGADKGKTMTTGLLQVLYDEQNPSLVTRRSSKKYA